MHTGKGSASSSSVVMECVISQVYSLKKLKRWKYLSANLFFRVVGRLTWNKSFYSALNRAVRSAVTPPPLPQPLLHKGSNPTIKVLIKGTDTLYWSSKSSFSQSAQRWMVYCHLFVVHWSPAQGCHRFLISLRFQFRCLINYFGNVSLCTGWNKQNQINAWKTSAHSRLSVEATRECSMKMWWGE